jgi:hypothetical protein
LGIVLDARISLRGNDSLVRIRAVQEPDADTHVVVRVWPMIATSGAA